MKTASRRSIRQSGGFSLVEMMVTISVIGVVASMAVIGLGNILGKSKDRIARNMVETLNKGTRNFSHSNWDLKFTGVDGTAGDEMLVFRSLQWREPEGAPNETEIYHRGPYIRDDWNPATSNDAEDWRIKWTGSAWKLLLPGTPGAGIKVDFDGTDLGTPYQFPDNFKPVGSR